MARPAKGNVYFEGGTWKCRITLPDGTRRRVKLLPWYTIEQAEAKGLEIARYVREHGVVALDAPEPAPTDETVEAYADRFLAWKEGRGQSTVADSRGRLRKWVLPSLRGLGIRTVSAEDFARVVRRLDDAVQAGEIEAATRATPRWATSSRRPGTSRGRCAPSITRS